MKLEKFTMAVIANHFSLYEAFKKEVEKLGWTYNSDFVEFSPRNGLTDCLYFSFNFDAMKGKPAFSLSMTCDKKFQLEFEFSEALERAKYIIQNWSEPKTFKLNDQYTADINPKQKTVVVGCQVFSFDTVRELTDLINELEMDYFVNKTKKKC